MFVEQIIKSTRRERERKVSNKYHSNYIQTRAVLRAINYYALKISTLILTSDFMAAMLEWYVWLVCSWAFVNVKKTENWKIEYTDC